MINVTKALSILATAASLSILTACDDGRSVATTGSGAGNNTTASTGSSTSASTSDITGGTTSSGGVEAAKLDFLATFDATKGELPEGLIVSPDGKTAYVGFAPTGQIIAISLADNKRSDFGSIPAPPMGVGLVLGLAFDKAGDLYVGTGSFDPSKYQGSIYKIAKTGGAGALFSKNAGQFANGLIFDASGNLFSSDTASGSIYKTSPDGTSTVWVKDALLQGDLMDACSAKLPIAYGINGISLSGSNLYAVNTDKGTLVKIPVKADGSAGTPVKVLGPDAACSPLKGPDGITTDDKDGSLLVMANLGASLVRVDKDGKATTLVANGPKFDSPASVVVATVNGKRMALITNLAFFSVQTPGATPRPGLLAYGPLP